MSKHYKQPGMKVGERELPITAGEREQFEQCADRVRDSVARIGQSFWDAGDALIRIRDGKLYRADGHTGFSAFLDSEEWCKTRQTAYNMMNVSAALSKAEATRFGPTISYVIAAATDEKARAKLTRLADEGCKVVELKRAATEIKRAVKSSGELPTAAEVIPIERVRASAQERTKVGFGKLEPIKSAARIADGWTHKTKLQLGEDGPDVLIEVNMSQGALKCKII